VLAASAEDLKAMGQDIENLKESQKAIQKDLGLIKDLLQGKRSTDPAPVISLDVEGAPFLGDKNAKVTLIEFTDYQCPFCGRHAAQTMPRIITDYVKPGTVKYVILEDPMESLHPAAWKAAEAAHCAGEQGKYWEMHDQIFAHQRAIEPKDLSSYAKVLGLDVAKFSDCVETGKLSSVIRNNRDEADKAGVDGTPTFFIGITDQNSSAVKTSRKIVGALPYNDFKQAIEYLVTDGPKE
jgi:protein-disulfide isomerase